MKITGGQEPKDGPVFPALYRSRHNDIVVLFTELEKGVVVERPSDVASEKLGESRNFTPCTRDYVWEPLPSHTIHSAQPKREPLTFGDVEVGQLFTIGPSGTLYRKLTISKAQYMNPDAEHDFLLFNGNFSIHAIYPNATLDLGPARRFK